MRLACVRLYVCVKEAASIVTRRIQFCRFPCTDNQAGVAHCQVQYAARAKYLQCLRVLPIHFFGDSLARNQRQSIQCILSRLFSKKPQTRERGAPGLTPRSRSIFFTDSVHFFKLPFFLKNIGNFWDWFFRNFLCLLRHCFPLLSPPSFILGLICRWLSRRNKVTTALFSMHFPPPAWSTWQ